MTRYPKQTIIALVLFSLLSAGGCTRHEVAIAPVEIKPIHITIDVNVKVDKALDDFFGDLDENLAE
ncbi:YnbE family lipoprotein [Desulforhopalus singaporensis]|uniref:YnbE-like lipoprotein n=1 Tax=Desulforhopalus singaporensis TaxID=91360 RepID=A0A1H0ND39_9BACT|nr:YnbE family lipoprotein [Desulforhopalus singaporensis]SDO90694.1 YnbE-like lipoprotein [Desulforhopalus singaporensis]